MARSHAKFDRVDVIFDLWDGSLPMRRTENQRDISNNVLFVILKYGEYISVFGGVDFYHFKEDDLFWTLTYWTDPTQDWAVPNEVGHRLIFSKTSDEFFDTRLREVPRLSGFHEGIMIPDEDWRIITTPGRILESLR